MSIKTTITLTRRGAEELVRDFEDELYGSGRPGLTDRELEELLDELAEAVAKMNGDTCFTNYIIR